MDSYTMMVNISAISFMVAMFSGAVVLALMSNKLIRAIVVSFLGGGAVCFIHNSDNTVDILTAKRGKKGISSVLNTPDKYGIKFAPAFNKVEKANTWGTKILHFYFEHNSPILPAEAKMFSDISEIFKERGVNISSRNIAALFYVIDEFETDEEIIDFMNCFDGKASKDDVEVSDESEFTREDLDAVRALKQELLITPINGNQTKTIVPFLFQEAKKFMELLDENSSVLMQNMIALHIEIERGLRGGFMSTAKQNYKMILLLAIGAVAVVVLFPTIQKMMGL